MVVAGANVGIQRMTKEHLGIALALRVPVFVVVTKIDIAPPDVFRDGMTQLQKLLKVNAPKQLPLGNLYFLNDISIHDIFDFCTKYLHWLFHLAMNFQMFISFFMILYCSC